MFRKHASASTSNASFSESNKASHGCSAVLPTERKSLRAFLRSSSCPRAAPASSCPPPSAPSSRSSVRAMQESSASFRANRSRGAPRPSAGSRSGDSRGPVSAPGAGANVWGVPRGQGARGPRSGARPRTAREQVVVVHGIEHARCRRSRRPGARGGEGERWVASTSALIHNEDIFRGRFSPGDAAGTRPNPSLNRRDPRLRLARALPNRNAREARAGELGEAAGDRRGVTAGSRGVVFGSRGWNFTKTSRQTGCQSPSKNFLAAAASPPPCSPSPPSCSSSPCSCASASHPTLESLSSLVALVTAAPPAEARARVAVAVAVARISQARPPPRTGP